MARQPAGSPDRPAGDRQRCFDNDAIGIAGDLERPAVQGMARRAENAE
ncbi:MAG TPA: hypothetical protein PLX43_07355 [Nitrobacter sp.]|nr:hypothetical protein [Nitrobacter sp.]